MFSKKQEDFLIDDLHRINLLYGSVRSGKTWISLLKWAIWVGQQASDKQFLMVGKTITTLKRNCLVLLEELIVGDGFRDVLCGEHGMELAVFAQFLSALHDVIGHCYMVFVTLIDVLG